MNIFDKADVFSIKEESLTFKKLIDDAPVEIANMLKEKSVLILPSHGHNDAYYSGTLDTLDFLNESGLIADVYASDDEYKELSLHGNEIWLGTFIMGSVVVPVFINIISSYIYDKLKAKDDDNIALKFMVENSKGKTTAVEFNGKVENLGKVIDAVKSLGNED